MTAIAIEKKSKKMKRSAEEAKVATESTDVAVVEKKAKKSKKEKKTEEADEPVKEEKVEEKKSEDVVMEDAKEEKKKKKKSKKSTEDEETVVPEAVKEEKVEEKVEEAKKEKKSKKSKKSEEKVEEEKVEEPKSEEPEKKEEEPKSEEPASTEEAKDPSEMTKEERDKMTIIVFGLPFEADESTVKKDFEDCGEVVDFRMPMRDGVSRGMCFIQYKTQVGIDAALKFNQSEYGGRTLGVRMCESDKGKGKDGAKGGKDSKGKGKKGGKKGGKGNEKPDGCTSVVVKLLAPETTENSLWELFEEAAPSKIKLVTDRETGESKCMAFVDFDSDTTLDKAIAKNNSELDGKVIWVSYNAPREPKGEGKGFGKDGKDGGKGKGKGGKGKGKKGFVNDPIKSANAGAITAFQGTAKTLDDSDSD